MAIINSHDDKYTLACVRQLHIEMHVPLADMQNLRVCLALAASDPSQLERGVPDLSRREESPSEVIAQQSQVADPNRGLRSFELHPKTAEGNQLYSGLDKFNHLVKLARRSVGKNGSLLPSAHIDAEMTAVQKSVILNPSPLDYAMSNIVSTAHGEGAKQVCLPCPALPCPAATYPALLPMHSVWLSASWMPWGISAAIAVSRTTQSD